MYENLSKYTQRQINFTMEYLIRGNIAEACEIVGITPQTANNWLKAGLSNDLEQVRNYLIADTLSRLKAALTKSLSVMIEIMEGEDISASVRLNAAKTIFDNFLKTREQEEVINRLNEIENKINDKESK